MDVFFKKIPSYLVEETVLFTSVIKWFILSLIVGILVGASTTLFLLILEYSSNYISGYGYYYFLLLPIGMFLSSAIVRYLAPDAVGHGTEKVIEAIHKKAGKIKFPVVPVKFLATVLTISTGGSVGKEGPSAQIGGGIASLLADLFRFSDADRKKLVICGISAGFSTVFGTPIAGAIFGIEVLYIGEILYDALFPSFVSGMVAYQVAHYFGLTYSYYSINFIPSFNGLYLLESIIAGISFGIISLIFIQVIEYFDKLSKRIKLENSLKGVLGGAVLVILTLILNNRSFLGLGLDTIKKTLEGVNIGWYYFFVKMLFTGITLGFGGSGGIITPILFVGATAGSLFAQICGADKATFAAVGMVSILAGATNTPISSSIMAVELFGANMGPYAAIICIISYLITGHRSVYPSQVLVRTKSSSIKIEPGTDIEYIHLEVESRKGTLFNLLLKILKTSSEMLNKLYESLKNKWG